MDDEMFEDVGEGLGQTDSNLHPVHLRNMCIELFDLARIQFQTAVACQTFSIDLLSPICSLSVICTESLFSCT
jgi:hypothetical protein